MNVQNGLSGKALPVGRLPLFLDIEASSLRRPGSYPTEIAWSTADGAVHECLIRPEPQWTDWSESAEMITGLSRDLLRERGQSPAVVAATMNRLLHGEVVYCDGGAHDAFWLERLYEAARVRCEFRLADIRQLIPRGVSTYPDWQTELQLLVRKARGEAGLAHRAAADVRYLQRLYLHVRQRLPALLRERLLDSPMLRQRRG
jgi:hypothetical protein